MKKIIKHHLAQLAIKHLGLVDELDHELLEAKLVTANREKEYLQGEVIQARRATESVKAVVQPHLTGRTYGAKLDNGRVVVQVHATQDARVNRDDVIRAARNITLILWHNSPQVVEAAKSQIKLLEETT